MNARRHTRSVASWFYRITIRPGVRYVAAGFLIGGWAFAIFAANSPFPQTSDDTSVHLAFAGTVLGGALGLFGMLAGVSRWVAEPAARKVLAEHMRLGVASHLEFVPRSEWDQKHVELMQEVYEIKVMIAEKLK